MADVSVRRRFQSSNITIVISIALVLIMLGLLTVLILKAKTVSDHVKENIVITLFLDPALKDTEILALQKSIDVEPWRKATAFVTKEEAAKSLQQELGEDFIKTLGYNPLSSSIEISLRAEYANNDSIAWIERQLREDSRIEDVIYQKDMVGAVNERLGSISLVILVFSGALLFVAVGLIFNTIRLAIYSQRFLIRTMNLVGATQAFIRRPFVLKGIRNGIVGAFLAIGITVGIVLIIDKNFRDLKLIQLADVETLGILCLFQILLGILITWISSALAVRKFALQSTDALYMN
ncbi:MAG: permease-like cell division protein FtsX [Bacteroidetes bacterium]|jgi:cell division transport system permease protein|nr:permease-like cell division protein FtsX [Bacteroidota bacterium]